MFTVMMMISNDRRQIKAGLLLIYYVCVYEDTIRTILKAILMMPSVNCDSL